MLLPFLVFGVTAAGLDFTADVDDADDADGILDDDDDDDCCGGFLIFFFA